METKFYIFHGKQGTGKTTAAKQIIKDNPFSSFLLIDNCASFIEFKSRYNDSIVIKAQRNAGTKLVDFDAVIICTNHFEIVGSIKRFLELRNYTVIVKEFFIKKLESKLATIELKIKKLKKRKKTILKQLKND